MTRVHTRGSAVVDGEVKYFSPSALSTGDPDTYGGCPRRYFFKYVMKKPEPSMYSQEVGTQGHAEIEHYLLTGEKTLGEHALPGAKFIPAPGKDLLVEHPIDDGLLTLAGVPVIGYIDLIDPRSQTTRDDGEKIVDPNGTIEIVDWKFTGSKRRMESLPTGKDLGEAIPMITYGEWAARKYKSDWVRLSHVYFATYARDSRKVSVLARRVDIAKRWNRVESVGRSLLQVVKETDPASVEANLNSCSAYGGCPHAAYCPRPDRSLADIFGETGAQQLQTKSDNNPEGDKKMSVLDRIKKPAAAIVETATQAPEVKIDAKAALLAQIAELEAQEKAAAVPPGFTEAWGKIESAGRGTPALGGAAALAYAAMRGQVLQGDGYAGTGEIGELCVTETAEIFALANELDTAPPSLLPPGAADAPPPPAEAPKVKSPGLQGKPGPGRPRKVKPEPQVPIATDAATPRTEFRVEAEGVTMLKGLVMLCDVLTPNGLPSLDGYVEALVDRICKEYDIAGLRLAHKDSVLSFGGWRDALAALAKAEPPADGAYTLDTRGCEYREVVAVALRSSCALWARGVGR